MKIDPKKFLALAGTISAATLAATTAIVGCTVNNTTTNSPDASGTGTDTPDTGTSSADGSTTTDGASNDDASTCLGTGTATGCKGDTDAAVTCASLCTGWDSNMKPEVAASVYECAVKLPGCEGDTTACENAAFSQACADTDATAVCEAVVSQCTDAGIKSDALTQTSCEHIANGLTAAGRTKFISCITELGCSDPSGCLAVLDN